MIGKKTNAREPKIEIFRGTGRAATQFFLRVRAANGEIIATGAEGYASKGNAKKAAVRLGLACGRAKGLLVDIVFVPDAATSRPA